MPKRWIRVTDVIDPRIQCGPSAASISGHMRMPHRRARRSLGAVRSLFSSRPRKTLSGIAIVRSASPQSAINGVRRGRPELLPVPYCHVVFTWPQELSRLALQNPRLIYSMLFRAVSEVLLTIAASLQAASRKCSGKQRSCHTHPLRRHIASDQAKGLPRQKRWTGSTLRSLPDQSTESQRGRIGIPEMLLVSESFSRSSRSTAHGFWPA
jgi:hypothetical protein